MIKFIKDFLLRGLVSFGFGPIVLAFLYLILQQANVVETLTVSEVCIGVFSLSALAFIAGGMNAIYQIERLPLMVAIFIHGSVLYVAYLVTYIFNSWLEWGVIPVLVFTAVFLLGYLAIWAVIYVANRNKTEELNKRLLEKQQTARDYNNQ